MDTIMAFFKMGVPARPWIAKRMCFALLAISIFIALPLFGQSPWAAARLMGGENALLLYFGDDGNKALGQLQAMLRTDELVEMNLRFRLLDPASQNARTARQELRVNIGSKWALADKKGFLLAQGDKAPTAEALIAALESAGIRSPIKVLREFLRRHPDQLDARLRLLTQLRKLAEMRTMAALQIEAKTTQELAPQNDPEYMYRLFSRRVNRVDTSAFRDKRLEAKDDIVIWGSYAHEMDTLFRSEDWRKCLTDLSSPMGALLLPVEICSPLMRSLYGRFLPQIKRALQERPNQISLWNMYAWMRNIAGDKEPFQQVIASMQPSPVSGFSWPMEETYGFFEEEARVQNKWQPLADLLWERRTYIMIAQRDHAISKTARRWNPRMVDGMIEVDIRDFIEPLLESLLKTSRMSDAESIVIDLSNLPHSEKLINRAIAVANKCNMPELANKWSKIEIQTEKEIRDSGYLELLLDLQTSFDPTVILINGEAHQEQFDSLFEAGALLDWQINTIVFDSHMSGLMQERENWLGDETRWALLVHNEDNNKARQVFSGIGVPSSESIAAALENGRVEKATDILRRFIKSNPNHIEAKESLLFLLQKIAFEKTNAKISEIQNKDGNMELSSNDDYEIWDEYAVLFRQLMYYYFKNQPAVFWLAPPDTKPYQYSPTMRAIARELLPSLSLAVQRQPGSWLYWNLWASLSDPASSTEYDDLMEVLVFSLQDSPLEVPGLVAKNYLIKRYRQGNNWLGIEKLLKRKWEMLKNTTEITDSVLDAPLWEYDTLPLLEAYLNLKKDKECKDLLEIWKQSPIWESVCRPQAEEMFERYGRKGEFASR
jgi:hypothetical protein